jgi:hypothetical protein
VDRIDEGKYSGLFYPNGTIPHMSQHKTAFIGVAFCAVLSMGLACDDEEKLEMPTDPEPVKTGIPGTTPLDGLTPMQQQTLCMKSQDFLTVAFKGSEVQKALCKMTAVLAVSLGGSGGDPVLRRRLPTRFLRMQASVAATWPVWR